MRPIPLVFILSCFSWAQDKSTLTDYDRFKTQNMSVAIRELQNGQLNENLTVRGSTLTVATSTLSVSNGDIGIGTANPAFSIDGKDLRANKPSLEINGANPRLYLQGSGDAQISLIDTGSGAGNRTFNIGNNAGTTQIRALDASQNDKYIFASLDHSNGQVSIGGGTFTALGGIVNAATQPRFETNGAVSLSIANSSWFSPIFNTLQYHSGNLYNTTTGTTTIPTGGAGLYDVMCSGGFSANATGARVIRIVKNNTTVVAFTRDPTSSAAYATHIQAIDIVNLSASDTVRCEYFQDSGLAQTLDTYPFTKMVVSKRL